MAKNLINITLYVYFWRIYALFIDMRSSLNFKQELNHEHLLILRIRINLNSLHYLNNINGIIVSYLIYVIIPEQKRHEMQNPDHFILLGFFPFLDINYF